MRFILASLILLALPIPLQACLWDEDTTLIAEAGGLPYVVQIITGRFERNPPLYYQMRLERSARRIQDNPDDLAAYDNAGVACDRLGRDDEAIAWMEKKRARLDRSESSSEVREHRYRYLANVGTFWVHRWVRSGADRKRIDEVKTARDFIAKAIELNPDAHFGRETYQLRAMDWIIGGQVPQPKGGDAPSFYDPSDPSTPPAEAVRGLTGLIVLGNAWESVDVFNALTIALQADGDRTSMAYLSALRCFELIGGGHHSLSPDPAADKARRIQPRGNFSPERQNLDDTYGRLRAEAEDWHRRRTEYMMARLKAGRHPDTDPTFWKEYRDPGPPPLPGDHSRDRVVPPTESRYGDQFWIVAAVAPAVIIVVLPMVGLAALAKWSVRRPRRPGNKAIGPDPWL